MLALCLVPVISSSPCIYAGLLSETCQSVTAQVLMKVSTARKMDIFYVLVAGVVLVIVALAQTHRKHRLHRILSIPFAFFASSPIVPPAGIPTQLSYTPKNIYICIHNYTYLYVYKHVSSEYVL